MTVGQLVDFCIEYNKRQEQAEKEAEEEKKPKRRRATQQEIDAYFGG